MGFKGTTILAVRRNGRVAIAGDGQVTAGDAVMKGNARKIRRMLDGKIVSGFAGATADAFTLSEVIEKHLKKYNGDLTRAAVEMAKEWRIDRNLRRLDAMILITDGNKIFLISGVGDVLEPEYDAIAIGSGGNFAYAAARAYLESSDLSAVEIAKKSLEIAADICIYTNRSILVEEVQGTV
ncbi:MAG: ATP-dependent protease subunit HslV [Sphaerochaetaceae bacterium]|mgnify:CR=1 FL=1|nr:ATP-dependent protease subunit HslV [Sphaerochaetaceae bacterium]MDX9809211.1 ATP-dependent protease subunit HslV [Sphaerochaetaceae bacterium]NLV84711.1 ATP-dependent protease subunit HslV [Spirochaetales bacterium]